MFLTEREERNHSNDLVKKREGIEMHTAGRHYTFLVTLRAKIII